MKKFIILIVLIISFTTSLRSQWIKQSWPVFESVYGVSFFDANTGLVAMKTFPASQFVIFRTTNGGFNWNENYNAHIYGMQKIDSNTAFCWGQNQTTGYDKLFRTFNRGLSWDSINFGLNSLCDIYFLTKDTGWVTIFDGNSTKLYKTNDGGNTLTLLNSTGHYLTTSYFLKEKYNGNNIGYRSYMEAVKKTIDGGYNWIDLPALPIVPQYDKNDNILTQPDVTQISFVNKDTGWVTNGTKSIFKTMNGGFNWIVQNLPSNNIITAFGTKFQILNKDTLYLDGGDKYYGGTQSYGIIFKTTNSGTNWGYQQPDTIVNPLWGFFAPSFINNLTGWFSNIHTTNGGGLIIYAEIKNISVINPTEYQLLQNYPNPFNPTTTFDFYLPYKSYVQLTIYDITGKKVNTIINNIELVNGYHSYRIDGFSSLGLSSGIYFYQLTANDIFGKYLFKETKKMIYKK